MSDSDWYFAGTEKSFGSLAVGGKFTTEAVDKMKALIMKST